MKIIRRLLKICKFVFAGILAVALLLSLVSVFKRLVLKEPVPLVLGFGTAVVISGSMEPTIRVEDLIIIHRQSDYKIDDIVTYRPDPPTQSNRPITHRIIEKTPDGYVTKGDFNPTKDEEIEKTQIIGRVVKVVPQVGRVISFFQQPLGVMLLVFGLFVMIEAPNLFKRMRGKGAQ